MYKRNMSQSANNFPNYVDQPLLPAPQEQPVVMDMQFYSNVAKMTVMWCASSFGAYLLNFLNKYLEGTIFENNYVEASAGIIAILVGS